jgi:hypothetical protein
MPSVYVVRFRFATAQRGGLTGEGLEARLMAAKLEGKTWRNLH